MKKKETIIVDHTKTLKNPEGTYIDIENVYPEGWIRVDLGYKKGFVVEWKNGKAQLRSVD
jgi:hypothetical protein